jgi:hypothetical protein
MSFRDIKANPSSIVRAHLATYRDYRSGKILVRDHLLFEGLPLLVALGASLWLRVKLGIPASAGLLTVTGLLAALLFGVMLQISDRAMEWADNPPLQGPDMLDYAIFLRDIAANSGYASLVCIGASLAFVATSLFRGGVLIAFSAIGIALGLHLVLVVLMVMKRVYALTQSRLNRVITGAGRPDSDFRNRRAS